MAVLVMFVPDATIVDQPFAASQPAPVGRRRVWPLRSQSDAIKVKLGEQV